jgi:hypothetical protein
VAVAQTDINRPVAYLDDANRTAKLADWLAKQKWDPSGATAAALTSAGRPTGRTVEFLSRGYPNIVDPMFPDDPR